MFSTCRLLHAMDKERFFFSLNTRIWSDGIKMTGVKFRVEKSRHWYFFTQCIISLWNSLPQDQVVTTTMDVFKRGLYILMEDRSLSSY